MGTKIQGVASAESIDSSGEIVKLSGLDISSLESSGVFNFEHNSGEPGQIVGKILKAHKIFKKEDCEDDNQLYYWNKVKKPYLYVMGELFDDVGHTGAKDIAAMLKYDKINKNADKRNIINFSIEGAKLSKDGGNILKSIARKVAITITPCNHSCIADELVESPVIKKNSLPNSIKALLGKNESGCEIFEPMEKALEAGSGMASPSTLTQGAALGKQAMAKKKMAKVMYNKWDKKKDFHEFLKSTMPGLNDNEIESFSKVFRFLSEEKKEKDLKKMMNKK